MAKKLTLLDLLPVTAPGILTDAMKQDMQKYLSADTQVIHTQIPAQSPLSASMMKPFPHRKW